MLLCFILTRLATIETNAVFTSVVNGSEMSMLLKVVNVAGVHSDVPWPSYTLAFMFFIDHYSISSSMMPCDMLDRVSMRCCFNSLVFQIAVLYACC